MFNINKTLPKIAFPFNIILSELQIRLEAHWGILGQSLSFYLTSQDCFCGNQLEAGRTI